MSWARIFRLKKNIENFYGGTKTNEYLIIWIYYGIFRNGEGLEMQVRRWFWIELKVLRHNAFYWKIYKISLEYHIKLTNFLDVLLKVHEFFYFILKCQSRRHDKFDIQQSFVNSNPTLYRNSNNLHPHFLSL